MLVRQLSVLYLAAASSFGVAILLSQHPMLNSAAKTGAHFVGSTTVEAASALNTHVIQPGWAWTSSETRSLAHRAVMAMNPPPAVHATTKPVRLARREAPAPKRVQKPVLKKVALAPPPQLRPQIVEPQGPVAPAPNPMPGEVASNLQPKITLAPQAAPRETTLPQEAQAALPPPPAANAPAPGPAELIRVTQRLKDSLTAEMLQHFEMFLYVSKADHGPWAQRMYVFQKQPGGNLSLLYNWPVSTGRERIELAPSGAKEPSFTPAGYYQIDPSRMYTHYVSGQWRQPMPFAMFFNWENHGYQTGLAIHAASGEDISLLGTRSSAGCVRLAPENARLLFTLIRANYKGLVPKFAYDKRTATMANDGMMLHDDAGNLQMAKGYKVLVFIEDYGGENVVAALF